MIPGDGIGPEMMNYVKEVFTHAGVPVDFEMINFDPNSEDTEDLRQVRGTALALPVLKNKTKYSADLKWSTLIDIAHWPLCH